jgi:type I restriction enzyme S subunit
MNETLEGMAQAIFRDWFVDFGPVRRKLAGASVPTAILGGLIADPAQAANVAALFPDTLGDDGLPVGWEPNTLDSMLNLTYGKALPKTARTDGEIPVYGSGGIGGFHNEALVKGPGIIVGRKGTVGSLFWEPGDFFAIDTVFYVEPKDGYSLQFLWQLLQIMGLEGMNTDAAVPGLNRNNAHRLDVVCPPQPVLDAFDDLGGLLRQRLDACNAENHTLAETRGYLLPRLMSGKVRVADAERLTK